MAAAMMGRVAVIFELAAGKADLEANDKVGKYLESPFCSLFFFGTEFEGKRFHMKQNLRRNITKPIGCKQSEWKRTP